MDEIILLKMGELVLKGLNRRNFEDRLLSNVRRRLRPFGDFAVSARQSTVYAEPGGAVDFPGALDAMRRVFGVVAISRAAVCKKDIDAIEKAAVSYLGETFARPLSYKVESRRADKQFPLTSIQISQRVGGALHDAYPHLTVDVHAPEVTVFVEVRERFAYVHAGSLPGAGGLPVGITGRAVALLSGGIDSPVACHMAARRGVSLELVHFFSYPYTSPEAKEKVLSLARILSGWCGRMTVHVVPFTHVQEEIRKHCPDELFTLVMRRFMMRIAEGVAIRTGAVALVTGECIGQVASQTMEAMAVTSAACCLPVFRPVVAMDKEEIVVRAREIGTFETSILPYEDCCTVFTPRHPKTKPRLDEVEKAEEALDVAALVAEALDNTERVMVP
ncbi:MAG TPA: tRNA uracil 4-sulfurtransferase ThiI [Oscillospiraceae bacterium]|nr:tRNA uracil 4-sulfurtransferase ThiI [Oscillospiraceae bacterium]